MSDVCEFLCVKFWIFGIFWDPTTASIFCERRKIEIFTEVGYAPDSSNRSESAKNKLPTLKRCTAKAQGFYLQGYF